MGSPLGGSDEGGEFFLSRLFIPVWSGRGPLSSHSVLSDTYYGGKSSSPDVGVLPDTNGRTCVGSTAPIYLSMGGFPVSQGSEPDGPTRETRSRGSLSWYLRKNIPFQDRGGGFVKGPVRETSGLTQTTNPVPPSDQPHV